MRRRRADIRPVRRLCQKDRCQDQLRVGDAETGVAARWADSTGGMPLAGDGKMRPAFVGTLDLDFCMTTATTTNGSILSRPTAGQTPSDHPTLESRLCIISSSGFLHDREIGGTLLDSTGVALSDFSQPEKFSHFSLDRCQLPCAS